MRLTKRESDFINSDAGIEAISRLKEMLMDDSYNTESTYTANTASYPDNLMPFLDKHMNYLHAHPNIDPRQYLSHIRLMTRIRTSASVS